jgi:hypothetical protein
VAQFSIPGSSGDFPFDTTAFAHQYLGINNQGMIVGTSSTQGGFVANPNPVDTIDNGGTLYLSKASNDIVHFAGNTGMLVLEDAKDFHGIIDNFHGTAPDAAHSNVIDLVGIDYATASPSLNPQGQLQLAGGQVALNFVNLSGQLSFASDGHGGTLIFDPPSGADMTIENGAVDSTVTDTGVEGTITVANHGATGTLATSVKAEGADYIGEFSVHPAIAADGATSVGFNFDLGHGQINLAPGQTVTQSYDVNVSEGTTTVLHQTVSVSVGSSGADNFVFAPGIGANTIVNFDAQHGSIDLSHFENIQSVQQLASLVTANAHGDAVVDLGNHDSITIAGLNPAQLHQVMQSAVHLH